jgi:hypothetical protein
MEKSPLFRLTVKEEGNGYATSATINFIIFIQSCELRFLATLLGNVCVVSLCVLKQTVK